MAGTRSSARLAKGDSKLAPSQSKPPPSAGSKRKASGGAAPKSKKGKKGDEKEQTTIEASMPTDGEDKKDENVEMKDQEVSGKAEQNAEVKDASVETERGKETNGDAGGEAPVQEGIQASDEKKYEGEKAEEQADGHTEEAKPNGFDKLMGQDSKEKETADKRSTEEGTGSKVSVAENAVEPSSKREEATPSSILEKGIIYFFFRGRVGINEPTNVGDIARSYIVLRPLPRGAKLGDGPIGDEKNNRMLAMPKKVLPKSPKDRFMVFVEKANVSMGEIKESLSSSDYTTKTAGARHTPAATPIGEGVYAITQAGKETHLAYILTIPSELDAVQKGVGLSQRGSYFTSVKNPKSSSPANASLPRGAEYSQEIIQEFHGRGWMPLQPKLLNYENTQFLIIGHKENALEKAAKPQDGEDEKQEVETPLEEIEKLEHENELRVEHLDGA